MPTTIETTVYKFEELSDRAKEKVREWYRQVALEFDWWDSTYDDAERVGKILGIEFDRKRRNNPRAAPEPCIWFSGFWSQGDGACFKGSYSYANGAHRKIRKHAPTDAELHRIADCLYTLQRRASYGLLARMAHRGHYYHSGCMTVDVEHASGWDVGSFDAQLTQLMRDFADWIYRQLEAEHDYQLADEQVDESIRANEYTFTEDGARYG